jgi:hypothetical protein
MPEPKHKPTQHLILTAHLPTTTLDHRARTHHLAEDLMEEVVEEAAAEEDLLEVAEEDNYP